MFLGHTHICPVSGAHIKGFRDTYMFPGDAYMFPRHTYMFPGHTYMFPGQTYMFPGHAITRAPEVRLTP